jgi:ABC-2 type transport system permease protein
VRSFEGFGVFSNTIILPLYFTSSSVFPLDPALTRTQTAVMYPEWLVFLVQINPVTYAVDMLRGVLINFNQFPAYIGPTLTFSMVVGFFLLALWDFGRK